MQKSSEIGEAVEDGGAVECSEPAKYGQSWGLCTHLGKHEAEVQDAEAGAALARLRQGQHLGGQACGGGPHKGQEGPVELPLVQAPIPVDVPVPV